MLLTKILKDLESKKIIESNERGRLLKILKYGTSNSNKLNHDNLVFIGPRVGTISPWSSRATDICHHCDVDILRIERCNAIEFESLSGEKISNKSKLELAQFVFDQMTEEIFLDQMELGNLFTHHPPRPLTYIDILTLGIESLKKFNTAQGLALSNEEVSYLYDYFIVEKRNPTDAELMMFAQANSEHCRHKIFNGKFGDPQQTKKFFI